eukprot:TRINITY_DN7653_c0_g1_i4.p1 TRINITY_DN7653_c0_g1~~TRINITY_DN7653_c0_g1_i4.p1  ORF type:complete len:359 (-),score=-27.21 TRINITY_DN7653_c0_g1_i4:145-1221(-)
MTWRRPLIIAASALLVAMAAVAPTAADDYRTIVAKYYSPTVDAVCVGTDASMAKYKGGGALPVNLPDSDTSSVCSDVPFAPSNARYMYIGSYDDLSTEHRCPAVTDLRVFDSAASALTSTAALPGDAGTSAWVVLSDKSGTAPTSCTTTTTVDGPTAAGNFSDVTADESVAMIKAYLTTVTALTDVVNPDGTGTYKVGRTIYGAILTDPATGTTVYLHYRVAPLKKCPCPPPAPDCQCGVTCNCTANGFQFDPSHPQSQFCILVDTFKTKYDATLTTGTGASTTGARRLLGLGLAEWGGRGGEVAGASAGNPAEGMSGVASGMGLAGVASGDETGAVGDVPKRRKLGCYFYMGAYQCN